MENDAKCPYCRVKLNKFPKRKTKCKSCGKPYYPRTIPFSDTEVKKFTKVIKKCKECGKYHETRKFPKTRKIKIVTENEAISIDDKWWKIRDDWEKKHHPFEYVHGSISIWLDRLEMHGITKKDYDDEFKGQTKSFKTEVKPSNVIWTLLNRAYVSTKNLHELSMLSYSMAIFLAEEGRDPFESLKDSARMRLYNFKNGGCNNKVEISGPADCESCKKLNGKRFTIDEALKKMPVPNRKCQNKGYVEGEKFGFCRCVYIIVPNSRLS